MCVVFERHQHAAASDSGPRSARHGAALFPLPSPQPASSQPASPSPSPQPALIAVVLCMVAEGSLYDSRGFEGRDTVGR